MFVDPEKLSMMPKEQFEDTKSLILQSAVVRAPRMVMMDGVNSLI